jgi:hypothetical protein
LDLPVLRCFLLRSPNPFAIIFCVNGFVRLGDEGLGCSVFQEDRSMGALLFMTQRVCFFSPLFFVGFCFLSLTISHSAFAWVDARAASVRALSASPAVSLDRRILGRVSEAMHSAMAPVYAVLGEGEEVSELVGLRDSHVWQATTVGRTIAMERLGALIDMKDRRVRDAEAGVVGSRAILAYEDDIQKALITVLAASGALYSVHQSGAAFSVTRIGSVAE